MQEAVGKIIHLPFARVGGVGEHVAPLIILQAAAEADDEPAEFSFVELIAVDQAVAPLGVADGLFAGAPDDEAATGGRDETELMVAERQSGDRRADARSEETEQFRVEDLAGLDVELRDVRAARILQHGDRERNPGRSGVARIGRHEQGRDGSARGGTDADDRLAADGGRVELIVVELRQVDVGAFAAVGSGEVDADFPAPGRTCGEREVVAVGCLAVGIGVAAVATVDTVGINVIPVADSGGEVSGLGLIVIEIARHAVLPESELQAEVFAHAFAGWQGLIVDIAGGVEVELGIGAVIERDAHALQRGVDDGAGRQAVVADGTACEANVSAEAARLLGPVADHGVDAPFPPFAEQAETLATLIDVLVGIAPDGALAGARIDRAGEAEGVARGGGDGVGEDQRLRDVGFAVRMHERGEGPFLAAHDLGGIDGDPDRRDTDAAGVGHTDQRRVHGGIAGRVGLVECPLILVRPGLHVLKKCAGRM